MKIALIAAASTLLVALPVASYAQCGPSTASSSSVSCENGVRVVRHTYAPLPSVAPATAAQTRIQRERIALERARLRQQAAQAERQARQEDERIRNQGYLYRDANSPLRQRTRPLGYGTRGISNQRVAIITPR